MADYDTKRLHVLDDLKPVERPEHVKRWADEFLAEPAPYEPMIFRKLRENAEAIRNMGREEILKSHRLGVDAYYTFTHHDIGHVMLRESPDGIRHIVEKVDGEWIEIAQLGPRPDWQAP